MAQPDSSRVRRAARPSRRRGVIAWVVLGILAAALAVCVGVVGVGAYVAQRELRAAVPLLAEVQTALSAQDGAALAAASEELTSRTRAADAATDTIVWRAAEALPFVGPTLEAVRTSAGVADDLAENALQPLARVDFTKLRPAGGQFDLTALASYAPDVASAADAFDRALVEVDGMPTEGVLNALRAPVGQLGEVVRGVQPALHRASLVLPTLPSALGADGPRNYLLLVQNNAEARGAGGIPASLALLTADQGRISLTQQASSSDFDNDRNEPIVALDPAVATLYDDKIARYVQDLTSVPDFALSSQLAQAWWAEAFGTPIDGVIAVDPVALSYFLQATGPITLATGDTIDAQNAVSVLLSEVYARYPDNASQDAYFAAAAVSIFDAISSGEFGTLDFAQAIARSVDERRLLFRPNDAAQLDALAGSRLLGELPADNAETTALGVFVNDLTEAKLSYYTDMRIIASSDHCTDGTPTFATTVAFTNGVDRATSDALPRYVDGGSNFPKGTIGTDIMFYGPVGGRFVSATFDDASVSVTNTTHLGRPAATLWVVNEPQQTHTMTVVFEVPPGDLGPVSVVHTPMVRDVAVAVEPGDCG